MERFYPLTFAENRHNALWGSEAWEISGHPSSPSVVAEGAFAGRTLDDIAAEFGRAFMGERAPSATSFPLLFKVIDARSRLSVQVHPSEATQPLTGGEPKTEMWRVISGSGPIFAGLKPGTTSETVAENVQSGRFEESLVRHQARPGLTLFIPGGLVHAIGEDVVLYEVQQSSNTTFRLYDWGRVDANGKPRELHVASALKAIDYTLPTPDGDVSLLQLPLCGGRRRSEGGRPARHFHRALHRGRAQKRSRACELRRLHSCARNGFRDNAWRVTDGRARTCREGPYGPRMVRRSASLFQGVQPHGPSLPA